MERIARILAEAGFIVLAPFVREHLAIRAASSAADDLMVAFDELERIATGLGLPAPAVFSASFGSNPAIRLCGDPRYARRVRGLYLFGGFADFTRVCRFAALGEWETAGSVVRLPFDPTNPPGVFLNIVEYLGVSDVEQAALSLAWREMCVRTWNRDELKRVEALRPIAHELAHARVPAALHELFLQGCGVAPGMREVLLDALARADRHRTFLDPRRDLANLIAPVVIAHGRSDAVVCFHEAAELRALLPPGHPHRYFVTGMFAHGSARIPSPQAAARELATLLGLVHAMAALPLGTMRSLD